MKRRSTGAPAIFLALLFVQALPACHSNEKNDTESASPALQFAQDDFVVKRGVNISHWLSQSERRGGERAQFFVKDDMDYIASLGHDHVRIPIDEEQMWDLEGNKEPSAFRLLHEGIGWARSNGLRIVVDLHILRSHHFNEGDKPLWTEPEAQERFLQCWRELSDELHNYPTELVAYEIMNEPVADDPEDWNRLAARCVDVIREREPERYVVLGSNRWQSVHTFEDLRVPEGDPYIILSFHFYIPFLITHHQASWTNIAAYDGPVHYPGKTVLEEDLAGYPDDVVRHVQNSNGVFTRDTLEALMQPPIELGRQLGLKVYCGEWGCYKTVPDDIMLRWYGDVRHCLEKNGVGWANWDYKGGFGIVDQNGRPYDDLIDVLLDE